MILPSNNQTDRDTDEESGDKNYLLLNYLNRTQLLAGATVDLSASNAIFC